MRIDPIYIVVSVKNALTVVFYGSCVFSSTPRIWESLRTLDWLQKSMVKSTADKENERGNARQRNMLGACFSNQTMSVSERREQCAGSTLLQYPVILNVLY